MRVQAITVKQPWAEWIIAGRKDVENRRWATAHRGLLAIHAGRNRSEVHRLGLDLADFTFGAVIGFVELVDVVTDHTSTWALAEHHHWLLARPVRLPEPLVTRGWMGLFTVELAVPMIGGR